MTSPSEIAGMLDALTAQAMAAEPTDAEQMTLLGSAVNNILAQAGNIPSEIEPLLNLSRMVLQELGQKSSSSPASALDAVSAALGCSAEHLADPTGRRSSLSVRDAVAALSVALGFEPPAETALSGQPSTPAELVSAAPPAPAEATIQATTEAAASPSDQPQCILPLDADMLLMKDFITECLDHIAAAEAALLDLEVNCENGELINTIFRAFHTIKGTSAFLGLDRIQRLAHLAESLLNRGRDNEIRIRGGYADLALKSCDTLQTMIEVLRDAQPGQSLPVPAYLDDLLTELTNPEAHGISDETNPEGLRLGDILVAQGAAPREVIEQVVKNKGTQKTGQAGVESGVVSAEDVAKALRTQKKLEGAGADSTIRVSTARLDTLINMVGELVIAQSMVAQDRTVATAADLGRKVTHADKIVRELQDLTMSLRMVPLRATFQKMTRLVRDLGRKSGKSVRFVSEGEDTEIDRSMVEVLNDPLVHMIRNSVDHGIEPAENRLKAGKDSTGTVTLRAYHAAGKVVIELCDDGQGLNKERVLAKAVEKGLVAKGREMTESEIFGLIFQPGFSTAEKVTDISGRGVGMDVVRKSIDSLRGQIDVNSTQGEGSTFKLRLPLTMAISDAMLVRVGGARYLLPTISILHSFRPVADQVSTVVGHEMVHLRGQLLPILRLARLFNIPGAVSEPEKGLLIVLESHSKRCAVMVDELLGQQQVVIKSLGSSLSNVPGVAGGAILGDGRVGLILDPTGIAELSGQGGDAPIATAA